MKTAQRTIPIIANQPKLQTVSTVSRTTLNQCFYKAQHLQLTSNQSNLAMAASNALPPPSPWGDWDTCLTQCSLVTEVSAAESEPQFVQPFSTPKAG